MNEYTNYIASIEDVIEDARNGKMFILVDAEDRENEGDLVIPAQMVTPAAINFMARFGRGLICLALTAERGEQLKLNPMSQHNGTPLGTAFTVSIEAKEGISTGISAHDRAHTVTVAIDPTKGVDDIVSPGHVFPLIARQGGVLVRTGHTEAAVDISRLAGLYPAGVICEIMNDDGTMARLPDLVGFAQLHNLKIGTIADLIAYRRRYDHPIKRVMESNVESDYGGAFKLIVYQNQIDHAEHIALVKGDISGDEPVLVRMHAVNVFEDLLGFKTGRQDLLPQAMQELASEGRGVLVLIRDTKDLAPMATGRRIQDQAAKEQAMLKEYGVGAQILTDLGVTSMQLLSRTEPRKIVGLEGYGLTVEGHRDIPRKGDN
ncbi:Riboflavin biosynthesis protein RibBA [Alphaproteobacteria bacterium SO-S41]|nr:Riboflavin biosynthesis protein RibBA [Alphaproteobacteria bacterium SO-S41]